VAELQARLAQQTQELQDLQKSKTDAEQAVAALQAGVEARVAKHTAAADKRMRAAQKAAVLRQRETWTATA
jgi:cell division protein FtsB